MIGATSGAATIGEDPVSTPSCASPDAAGAAVVVGDCNWICAWSGCMDAVMHMTTLAYITSLPCSHTIFVGWIYTVSKIDGLGWIGFTDDFY